MNQWVQSIVVVLLAVLLTSADGAAQSSSLFVQPIPLSVQVRRRRGLQGRTCQGCRYHPRWHP